MQAIIVFVALAITFAMGYTSSTAVHERDELKLAMQYEAKAKAATTALTTQTTALEAQYEASLADMRARYDGVRGTTKTVYVRTAPACPTNSDEAASSDGLSERVGIAEGRVIDLLQAADENTQSLMACQAYIGITKGKQ